MLKQKDHISTLAQYQNLLKYCEDLAGKHILVIGDIMVDEYLWGVVKRISPEAPVPVVQVQNETMQLGGAANVVNNLRALDAEVTLAGVIGTDALGERVLRSLDTLRVHHDGIVRSRDHQTIRKTRVIAHSQQVVRVDKENISPISRETEDRLMEYCLGSIGLVDGVIISDYAKGAVTSRVARAVIEQAMAAGKVCAVDPKVKNWKNYHHCTVITPNHLEAAQITGVDMDEAGALEKAGVRLMEMLSTESVLITCGEKGMALFRQGSPMEMIDTVARSVYDVTGAGDTVISALTLAMAAGVPVLEAAMLANFAAGVVVGKVGTATASIHEIKKAMKVHVS